MRLVPAVAVRSETYRPTYSRQAMVPFVKATLPLIDAAIRRRIVASVGVAILLAGLEALGLILVLPVVEILASDEATELRRPVRVLSDALGEPSRMGLAAVLGAIVLVTFIAKGAFALLYLRWSIGTALGAEASTASRLLAAYLGAPYAWHLQQASSDLQSRVHEGTQRVFREGLVAVVGAAADIVLVVFVATALMVVQPQTTVVAGVYFALVAIGYQKLIHGRAAIAGDAIIADTGRAFQAVQQGLDSIKTVRLGHHQRYFVEEYENARERSVGNLRTLMLLYQTPRYYLEIALVLGVAVMAIVLFATEPTPAAVAGLGLFLAAGFRLLPSMNRITIARSAAESAVATARRLVEDLRLLETVEHGEGAEGPPESAEIELDELSFSYGGPEAPVLDRVSLSIDPGTSVAFVGSSGAGKTTLVDLVLGLLDPSSGGIRVGGRPLAEVRDRWQRAVGYVPQDCVILDGTLRSNVAFGLRRDEVDDEAVALAIRQAQLEDLVSVLPDGLDTRLQERGSRLSGGQRQRVAIARALYKRPSALVLDEATSSLDPHTEAMITKTVDELAGSMTLITVTHRLNTVRRCDQIFVLDGGAVAASGTFEELAVTSPIFKRLLSTGTTPASYPAEPTVVVPGCEP